MHVNVIVMEESALFSNHSHSARRFINAEHTGDYMQMGEERIHFYEAGEGTPLLLIHSYGQSLFTWHKIIEPLSEKYRVIAVDLLGCGYSTHPMLDYTISQHSELLFALLDGLGISKAHVCGFATGALIAMQMAIVNPDRIDRIVAISPGGLTMSMPGYIRSLNSSVLGWLSIMMLNEKKIEQMLTECFFDLTQLDEHMVHEYALPLEGQEARKSLLTMLQSIDEGEVISKLREIRSETLLLWGYDDKWHPLSMGDTFHVSIRDSHVCSIRNCGHIVHEEKPSRAIEYIDSFLSIGLRKDEQSM